ncbi:MAG TPA: pyrroline-5-carboxylate reductase [Steroidobacteraceae bacterium]
MSANTVAILGGGNMGRALIGGLLRRGMRAEKIQVAEVGLDARAALARDFAVTASADAAAAVADADVIVLAVKPQDIALLLAPLQALLRQNRPLVVSIAAGVRVASLTHLCGDQVPVVRAMPNRPALVGAGVTGLFAPPAVGAAAREAAATLLRAVGEIVWVANEEALDVVTALSGSGPAYFFLLAQEMMQAAVKLGLEPEAARKLAVGTLYGAGLLAQASDGDLQRLRSEVTSKGGTTQAALQEFASADLAATVFTALEAATRRSRELAAHLS